MVLGGDRSKALMNGMSAIIKETPRASWPLPHCEVTEGPSMNQQAGAHQTPNLAMS
jgi:hypothetical protein